MATAFDHQKIEEKWLQFWESEELFQDSAAVADPSDPLYLLFAFAYPSGSGLHVGHVESKTALDILVRYNRMQGRAVFFPVGWDAFGLPAENYAIKTGVPPAKTTKQAIDTFRRQIKRIGISYDWKNEIATSHPEYYRWTQWLFAELHQAGLAYQDTGMVNWCPSCQTVLANEQVVDGLCERCDTEVEQKKMKQWYFKITEYQDELISGLDQVDWPEPTKRQQLNWIGKSEGATITFTVDQTSDTVECFTTRLDTVFGVTYVVASPEKFEQLGLLSAVPADRRDAVSAYLTQAKKKTEEERKIGEKDKTGVDTGLTAVHPITKEEIPLFVADYVLANVGTGSVMGVPAHDTRDNAFAQKHNLPIIEVIVPEKTAENVDVNEVFTEYGVLTNSSHYTGKTSKEAQQQLVEDYAATIKKTTTYKLRDWLISRQRYWGVPIPVIYDPDGNPHLVADSHLPWELPTDVDFKPTGESPLTSSKELQERTEEYAAREHADLIKKKGWDATGKGWRPEYDTMDTFVDSSWYYLRYTDSRNSEAFASADQIEKWLPVNFYMIGPEHIVLHLLYSRFFTKFLRDQGKLDFDEPFLKMRHQGMILGPDGKKMSKSKGNVINPDDIIQKFGADTLRMYEMFMGPIEADKPWDTRAVVGMYKFLQRVHTGVNAAIVAAATKTDPTIERKLHQTIQKLTHDIPALKFNTAIAALMEFQNTWEKLGVEKITPADATVLVKLLAPFAPFLAEELWQSTAAQSGSIHQSEWPSWDAETAQEEEITIAVQVDGKVRAEIQVSADQISEKEAVLQMAREQSIIQEWLANGTVAREIYVPGKIVNFVTA